MTTFDLRRLRLRSGDQARERVEIELAPLLLGGQEYVARPNPVVASPGGAVPVGANSAARTLPPSSGVSDAAANLKAVIASEVADAKIRLDDARHWRNRYAIEIQKKQNAAATPGKKGGN